MGTSAELKSINRLNAAIEVYSIVYKDRVHDDTAALNSLLSGGTCINPDGSFFTVKDFNLSNIWEFKLSAPLEIKNEFIEKQPATYRMNLHLASKITREFY